MGLSSQQYHWLQAPCSCLPVAMALRGLALPACWPRPGYILFVAQLSPVWGKGGKMDGGALRKRSFSQQAHVILLLWQVVLSSKNPCLCQVLVFDLQLTTVHTWPIFLVLILLHLSQLCLALVHFSALLAQWGVWQRMLHCITVEDIVVKHASTDGKAPAL